MVLRIDSRSRGRFYRAIYPVIFTRVLCDKQRLQIRGTKFRISISYRASTHRCILMHIENSRIDIQRMMRAERFASIDEATSAIQRGGKSE